MKKIVGLLVILSLAWACVTVVSKKAKIGTYEYWLEEEVALLITKEEREIFKKLTTDEERDKFKEIFWLRRDPWSETVENEFKDEWLERFDYVEATYTRGLKKGWRSDMGKVHMFFGEPWKTTGSAPYVRDAPMAGRQQAPGVRVWVFRPKPKLQMYYYFQIVFVDYEWGYELEDKTPQIVRRALEVFPKSVIYNPEIKYEFN